MIPMRDVYEVNGVCPVCRSAMTVTRLSCERCGSALEGRFALTGAMGGLGAAGGLGRGAEARFGRLARLDAAQLEFVEAFLRCRGVIKNVEDMLGISYPTVKARLANALATMGYDAEEEPAAADQRRQRREILADLKAGRMTTEEAHQALLRADAEPARDE